MPLSVTNRLFTGYRWDDTIGLYDANARFYDPQLGQFTQPDSLIPQPYNPIALNRYAYVYNSPVNYTDSSGHFIDTLFDAIDLYVNAKNCLGDSDALACYMVPVSMAAIVVPGLTGSGAGDNVLRATFDIDVPMTSGAGAIGPGHTGLSLEQAAIVATEPGSAVFIRARAETIQDLEMLWLSKLPDDENIIKFSNGGRIVKTGYGQGPIASRVSDLDTAFGVKFTKNGPRLMSNEEMIQWGERFNEAYGINLVTHGDLVSGLLSPNPEIVRHARNIPRNDLIFGYTSGVRLGSGSLDQIYRFIFNAPLP